MAANHPTDEPIEADIHPAGYNNEKKNSGTPEIQAAKSELITFTEKLGHDEHIAPLNDIAYVLDKVETLSVNECREILEQLLFEHKWDYNFDASTRRKIESLLKGPTEKQPTSEWELELKTEAAINKFYSPYPEVRAITTPTDDPSIPCETLRAHFLGLSWACVGCFINTFFQSRYPSVAIGSSVIQIFLYPCGMGLSAILPDWGFTYQGSRVSLNPGPWTYKEQMLSTVIFNVGMGAGYCFWNIQTQQTYYHDTWLTPAYMILLLLSTQMMGLGFAGLLRRFVVYPIETLWPTVLPTVALNKALLLPENKERIHGWSISRYNLFFIIFAASFAYFWLPGYLFQALSWFDWICWIAPNNLMVNALTGVQNGMGINPWGTFDWNLVVGGGDPLATPFFSIFQQFLGMFLGGLVAIALWMTNSKSTGYIPINYPGITDNTGNSYNITKVIDPKRAVLVQSEYEKYSPPFYGAASLVSYGAFFAFYPFTMIFIFLDAWRPIAKAYRSTWQAMKAFSRKLFSGIKDGAVSLSRGDLRGAWQALSLNDGTSVYDGFDDPFTNLMRAYPEVPDSWFLLIAFISFIFAIIICVHWKEIDTPVWTIFFVIGLNLTFLIPMTYLYATTGITEGLNVLTELIVGYALPGRPEALMFVKAFGYNINGQADNYISDQKMGFYAKIPPRAMFRGQMLSAFITSLITYAVTDWVDRTVKGICTPDAEANFTCRNQSQVFFNASVVWGAIGPKRTFQTLYPELQYCFVIGAVLAVVWWTVKRTGSRIRSAAHAALPTGIFQALNVGLFKPISWMRDLHPSLMMNGMVLWGGTSLVYVINGLYVGAFFNHYLRRYKTAWWEKYNYVISAALSGGLAFSAIIIFFAVQYHEKDVNWWGNVGAFNTLDTTGELAYLPLPEKGWFGPETWH